MRRDPYVAIMAAGAAGTGLVLTAKELADLYTDQQIIDKARAALNKRGSEMVENFGWAYLRYLARNILATQN